ncbi:Threonine dehydratase [Caenispirillum salinarum AK4]|uniref:L-serine dehydratase n=1 Tax=Caenispirillum salinarum AK4 TaxID=1238182 RepID=K9HTM1_9PROT|nr:threonine ammonia-lyase [Caenispirillum salinarum]EKV31611.1 Threonine dehydratase [Caenispirillum salinarum AK4]
MTAKKTPDPAQAPDPTELPDAVRMPVAAADVTLDDIRAAARQLAGTIVRTPMVDSMSLSRLFKSDLVLKLENTQVTGSFKARGALIKMLTLPDEQRRRGIVAMSAGNHAQGVSYHAGRLGIPATIVMPEGTPFTKVRLTEQWGAKVELVGETLEASREHADRLAAEHGLAFVHPYDDPAIVAGQGTVGLEMMEDRPDVDDIIVPIGGGGLMSGVATAVKAMNPGVRIIGVQVAAYAGYAMHRMGGMPPAGGQTLAEGIAVKSPGGFTTPILDRLVDELVVVDEPALERAVQLLMEEQHVVAEGAGAAPLAAVISRPDMFEGRRAALTICGGNIDSQLLASILLRGMARAGRMVKLRVEIPDRPGVLSKVAAIIGQGGGNIIEIYHHRLFLDVPLKRTDVDAVIEATDAPHVHRIIEALNDAGFRTRLLSTMGQES